MKYLLLTSILFLRSLILVAFSDSFYLGICYRWDLVSLYSKSRTDRELLDLVDQVELVPQSPLNSEQLWKSRFMSFCGAGELSVFCQSCFK